MKDKITELTYSNLEKMDKGTFKRLFKKPMPWQKATGVLLFAKQHLTNGKLPLVAIPFKKYKDAHVCFKEDVKKSSGFSAKLVLLARLEWNKELDGNAHITLTPVQGKMDLEYAQTYARTLFGKLKVALTVVGAGEGFTSEDLESVLEEGEELSDKARNKELKKQQKRRAKLDKVTSKFGKFEKSIGKFPLSTLEKNIEIFQGILANLEQEANEDGTIEETEREEIEQLKSRLAQLEQQVQSPASQLTEEQRKKISEGLDKMEKYLDKVIKKKKLYLPTFSIITKEPTKVEQILQLASVYRTTLDKVRALNTPENQELERLLTRVEQKALLVGEAYQLSTDDVEVDRLMAEGRRISIAYEGVSIVDMKALVPTAVARQGQLELLLAAITTWKEGYEVLTEVQKEALKRYVDQLMEMKTEGERVVELVNGNRLNVASRTEYAKVITANESTRTGYEEELARLQMIPEEDRSNNEKALIEEQQKRLDTLNEFEESLFAFIEDNPVRVDRVDSIRDFAGNKLEGVNGQAVYDDSTGEFVLELDASGGASLGAHELYHLVQAKQGKVVYLRQGGGTLGFFGDIFDEVETYKIQYSIKPSSVPGNPSSIDDITPDFVRALNPVYANYPNQRYGIDDSLATLNAHPQFGGALRGLFPNGGINDPATGNVVDVWTHYENWTFRNFLTDTAISQTVGENPIRTNREVFNFVIPQ